MIDGVFQKLGDHLAAYSPSYSELKNAIQDGKPPRHRLVGENNVRGYVLEATAKLGLARFAYSGLIYSLPPEILSGTFSFTSQTIKDGPRQVTGRYEIDRWGNLTFYSKDENGNDMTVTEIDAIYMTVGRPWMFHVSTRGNTGDKPVQKEFVEQVFGAKPISSKIRLQQEGEGPLGLDPSSVTPDYCKFLVAPKDGFNQVMDEFVRKYVQSSKK